MHISYGDFPIKYETSAFNAKVRSCGFSLITKISNLEKIQQFEYSKKCVSGMASFQASVSVKQPGHSGRAPALPLFFRKLR